MKGHADAETLAAFREELLSRRKAARVSAHLAACPRCAGLDAQLTEVTALLTRSAAPPMPEALTARIETAIAAEAAARAATTTDGAAADATVAAGAAGAGSHARNGAAGSPGQRAGRPARPPAGARRAVLALRVAAVTAAVAVVAGGGYGVVRLVSGNSTAGTAASERAPVSEPKAAAPGMSAGGSGSAAIGVSGSMASYPRVVSSGTNYQPGQLKAQVTAVLTRSRQHAATGAGPTLPAPANGPSARSPACVAQVTGGKRPLLVDLAKYQGRPATIIVVPGQRPGTLRALVVAGECTTPASRVLATVTLPGSG